MDEQKLTRIIKNFAARLPKFSDGRINYSNSNIAPVITVFVRYKDKILLLKRSDKVGAYRKKWNTVAGYLDQPKPIFEKALEELKEELGILQKSILQIKVGAPYKFFDSDIKKTWLVNPVLIDLKRKPNIKLDWEHTEYKWIKPGELKMFDTVPKLEESLKRALK